MEGNGAIVKIQEHVKQKVESEEAMAKKKADASGENKSELIRQKFAELGWDSGPKAVVEALAADGKEVSYALVSQVKNKHSSGSGGKKRGRKARLEALPPVQRPVDPFPPIASNGASSSAPSTVQLIRQVRELAKICGGKEHFVSLINEVC